MGSLPLDDIQTAIGPAYTLEREIGRGGMATVYLAQEKGTYPAALAAEQLAARRRGRPTTGEVITLAHLGRKGEARRKPH